MAGVFAGNGADTITASDVTHDVAYYGQGGDDTMTGLSKRDQMFGDDGIDIINAGGAADIVNGGRGIDTIDLGAGDDTLQVNSNWAEFDVMVGGDGFDSVVNVDAETDLRFNAFLSTVNSLEELNAAGTNVDGNGQDNVLEFANARLIDVAGVFGGNGADTITASDVTHDVAYYGQGGDDTMIGLSKRDQIFGDDGADTINAGGGVDLVDGGSGADIIDLGDGNDILHVNGSRAEFDLMTGGARQ